MVDMGFVRDRNLSLIIIVSWRALLRWKIRGVKGIINTMILVKEKGYKGVIIPEDNVQEASLIKG